MPDVLTINKWDDETQFASLAFRRNIRFQEFLKTGIRPLSYRRWNGRYWEVHVDRLPFAIRYARRIFHQIDYSTLPDWVQMKIAAASRGYEDSDAPPKSPGFPFFGMDTETPRDVLCVTEEAPWEVVQAAYRALCHLHHPDKGGETEKLQEINKAYAELKKSKK